jgi:hypothetical protein
VKQRCPLNSLLFSLRLEPLTESIQQWEKAGAFVDLGDNTRVEVKIQAYANDVVFISETREGIEIMLNALLGL